MPKGIFVTGTGTDVGKTFVTALLVKKLKEAGYQAGYYKAALSGAKEIADSDAGFVKKVAGIDQKDETLLSYLYQNAVSPHLAAKIEGNPLEMDVVRAAYEKVGEEFSYITMEGSGGIVCPIRWDEKKILLEDIVKELDLPVVIVADAGLGTINAVVLTVEYLKNHGMRVKGILLNHYKGGIMQEDNQKMIEELTGVPILATIREEDEELNMSASELAALYE